MSRMLGFMGAWIIILSGSASSWAGGLELGDTGAEAMGRAGAFAAKADNPAAINYNPAGFAKLTGHQIAISAHVIQHKYALERTGLHLPVDTQRPWFVAPTHLMFSTDFGIHKGFTLGLGLYVPASMSRDYPQSIGPASTQPIPSSQRYDTVLISGLVLFPSLVAAYRVASWLDIGASFQIWMLSTQSKTVAAVSSACSQAEDPSCDVAVEIKAEDWFSPTGSMGILLRPHAMVELGVMVRFPASAEATGRATLTFGPGVSSLQDAMRYPLVDPKNPKVTLKMNNPIMIKTGARVIFFQGDREVGDIELDFVFENWAAATRREVQIHATSLNKPMEPTVIDWKMKDTFALKLGGAYELPLQAPVTLVLRGGMSYESATTDISNTNLAIFSASRFGVSLGFGLRWKWLSVDVAYSHFFFPKRIVNNSTVRITDFGGTGEGPVVGNGTYESSVNMLTFQLGFAFGVKNPEPAKNPASSARPSRTP